MIFKDEEAEKMKAMREKYKKQLGIGMPAREQNEDGDDEQEEGDDDEEEEVEGEEKQQDFM